MNEIADGIIVPGPEAAFGFSGDLWLGDANGLPGSYLWKDGDRVIISLVIARHAGRGDFSRLLRAIEEAGFKVAVPTPMSEMRSILERKGFVPTIEETENGPCEMMVRP